MSFLESMVYLFRMSNHLIISTSLGELRALSLVSATLEVEYATQFCTVVQLA